MAGIEAMERQGFIKPWFQAFWGTFFDHEDCNKVWAGLPTCFIETARGVNGEVAFFAVYKNAAGKVAYVCPMILRQRADWQNEQYDEQIAEFDSLIHPVNCMRDDALSVWRKQQCDALKEEAAMDIVLFGAVHRVDNIKAKWAARLLENDTMTRNAKLLSFQRPPSPSGQCPYFQRPISRKKWRYLEWLGSPSPPRPKEDKRRKPDDMNWQCASKRRRGSGVRPGLSMSR